MCLQEVLFHRAFRRRLTAHVLLNSEEETVIHKFEFFKQFYIFFELLLDQVDVFLVELNHVNVFALVLFLYFLEVQIFQGARVFEALSFEDFSIDDRAFEIEDVLDIRRGVASDSIGHEKQVHWNNVFHLNFEDSVDPCDKTVRIVF
jgi:hypothetical protein